VIVFLQQTLPRNPEAKIKHALGKKNKTKKRNDEEEKNKKTNQIEAETEAERHGFPKSSERFV